VREPIDDVMMVITGFPVDRLQTKWYSGGGDVKLDQLEVFGVVFK
jgi:hypothetical protein